jgi:hypothetical protein
VFTLHYILNFIAVHCFLDVLSSAYNPVAPINSPFRTNNSTVHKYTGMHCVAPRTALHCTALHCTELCCTVLHCTALCCTALHCVALHCTALHCTALYSTALRDHMVIGFSSLSFFKAGTVLHCTTFHCTALHYFALHCNSLHRARATF